MTKIIKKEETELGIPRTKWEVLDEPTPKEKIKRRKGRGGLEFDYVETGYVVKKLDEVFNKAWDFEIIDKQVGQEHIWVLGKLTVKFMDKNGNIHTITKMQFGGSEVKRTKDGKVIDIADDLKAAASDSLKKCASLLGVAGDIYFQEKNLNTQEEINQKWQEVEQVTCNHQWKEEISKNTGKKYKVCQKCKKFEWIK